MKNNILITSAGTGNAYATALAINNYFSEEVFLVCADINPRHLVSSGILCNLYKQVPPINNSNYKTEILSLIKEYNINTCFSFMDTDVQAMCEWQENGEMPQEIVFQVKNTDTSSICGDKYKTFTWLKQHNITTPKTFLAKPPYILDKYILKPKIGFGSQIKIIAKEDADLIVNKEEYILQEICTTPEITVDVFCPGSKDDFYYLCRERIETKSGVCTKARLFIDSKLAALARLLSEELSLTAFCFQVMNLSGEWAVTDINPRLGAGSSMGAEIGMDFFAAMIAEVLDKDHRPYIRQYSKECFVTRQYQNILSR